MWQSDVGTDHEGFKFLYFWKETARDSWSRDEEGPRKSTDRRMGGHRRKVEGGRRWEGRRKAQLGTFLGRG